MDFKFDTSLIKPVFAEDKIYGSFPIFLFYGKIEGGQFTYSSFSWYAGSCRSLKADESYVRSFCTNLEPLRKDMEKALDEGADTVLTGYYDTILNKWVEHSMQKMLSDTSSAVLTELLDSVLVPLHNLQYALPHLLDANIKNKEFIGFEFSEYLRGKISLSDAYTWLKEKALIDNSDTLGCVPIILDAHVMTFLMENGVTVTSKSFYDFINTMSAYDLMDVLIWDKKTGLIDYFSKPSLFSLEEMNSRKTDFHVIAGIHTRFRSCFNV